LWWLAPPPAFAATATLAGDTVIGPLRLWAAAFAELPPSDCAGATAVVSLLPGRLKEEIGQSRSACALTSRTKKTTAAAITAVPEIAPNRYDCEWRINETLPDSSVVAPFA
jgi:hypothetical protein